MKAKQARLIAQYGGPYERVLAADDGFCPFGTAVHSRTPERAPTHGWFPRDKRRPLKAHQAASASTFRARLTLRPSSFYLVEREKSMPRQPNSMRQSWSATTKPNDDHPCLVDNAALSSMPRILQAMARQPTERRVKLAISASICRILTQSSAFGAVINATDWSHSNQHYGNVTSSPKAIFDFFRNNPASKMAPKSRRHRPQTTSRAVSFLQNAKVIWRVNPAGHFRPWSIGKQ